MTETNTSLIEAQGLTRYFGDRAAVRNADIRLRRGEVLGLLGPNGAGKTTTLRLLAGVLAPSSGTVHIAGIDLLEAPRTAKRQIGYLPEQPPLYRELSVDEYLRFCGQIRDLHAETLDKAVVAAKARCGLGEVGRNIIANLSKGFQQRVGIAQAILHNPAIVILDEPTVGLDPIQIREIRALIRELGTDHGVVLSTHILPEVEVVCDRVILIHRGQIVMDDSMQALQQMNAGLRISLRRPPTMDTLRNAPGVERVESIDAQHFVVAGQTLDAEALARHAVTQDWGLIELTGISVRAACRTRCRRRGFSIMLAIVRRELLSMFVSPLAWATLGVFTFIMAYVFLIQLQVFADIQPRLAAVPSAPGVTEIIAAPMFQFAATLLLLIAPFLTHGMIAGERRASTLTLLQSSPVTLTGIVVSKWLAVLTFFGLLGLVTFMMPAALALGTALDWRHLFACLLTLMLLMSAFAAIGVLVSALIDDPVAAAVLTFGVLLLLKILDWSTQAGTDADRPSAILRYLSMSRHTEPMLSGRFSSTDFGYFIIVTLLFLALAIWRLDSERSHG